MRVLNRFIINLDKTFCSCLALGGSKTDKGRVHPGWVSWSRVKEGKGLLWKSRYVILQSLKVHLLLLHPAPCLPSRQLHLESHIFSSLYQREVRTTETESHYLELQTVVHVYMNNLDKGVAPAICPFILSAGEFKYQPEPFFQDLYLLMYLASSRSGFTILGGINMQGNIAGATPTSSGSYTM